MRLVALLFLVFYPASSVAVAQQRVLLLVSEWGHASKRAGDSSDQMDAGCDPLLDNLPQYWEAKKKVLNFGFGPEPDIPFSPRISFNDVHFRPSSTICPTLRVSPARAPPNPADITR